MSDMVNNELKVHFLYKSDMDTSCLCQGDLLEITSELSEALNDIHPYFKNAQYKYFVVLTQSCDLVRRNGKNCKSPYITLAAVRSFDDYFKKTLLQKRYLNQKNGILLMTTKDRTKTYPIIERLYNNTEPEYFFFYKEEKLGLSESMVAYLKVSIALKSDSHYEKCLRAKRIELADEFKAKIGWLVGNMYSRVGTTDWESIMNENERTKMIFDTIDTRCIIGSKEQIKELQDEMDRNNIENEEEAREFILSTPFQTKYDKMLSIIGDVLETRKNLNEDERKGILNAIRSRSALKQMFPQSE